jgi:Sec-independent protein secretion pathway component TatC
MVAFAMALPFLIATCLCICILWIISHASIVLTGILGVFFFIIYGVGLWCAWHAGSFHENEEEEESHPQSGDEEFKGD